MTTTLLPNHSTKQTAPWRRIAAVAAGATVLVLTIAAIAVLLSPIGVRMRANQTSAAPVIGETVIGVLGDPDFNHVFSPPVTQIEVGDTVTWHFADIDEDGELVAHNVVFDDMASPVQTDGTFSRTFDAPGRYQYVCTLHPFMDGAVIVAEAQ